LSTTGQALASTRQLLGAYDPSKRLAQGWSIVTKSDGGVVRSLSDVALGDTVRVLVTDGSFDSTVNEKNGASS
jgi:exonuclease VII large subunit